MRMLRLAAWTRGSTMCLLCIALVAGCTEEGGPTDPEDPDPPSGPVPARLLAVQASVTGEAGTNVDVAARLSTANDAPVPGVTITFVVAAGSGSIAATSQTDEDGVASATWTLPDNAGAHTATASVDWSKDDRSFSASVEFSAEVAPPPPPAIPTITPRRIAAGGGHACYLDEGRRAICWGLNGSHELGTASLWGTQFSIFRTPVEVQQPDVVFTEIAAGENHTCALDALGGAWCWGRNVYGQLGVGTTSPEVDVPTAVSGNHSFIRLALGEHHSCGVTSGGEAYCWGGNFTGQLGDGLTANASLPSPVAGGHRFADLAAGHSRTCGIDDDGQALCWGGVGSSFVRMPTPATSGLRFFQIAVTAGHACGRVDDGRTVCWGNGPAGQLGNGGNANTATPVDVSGGHVFRHIVVGHQHSCGIDASDLAWCWGLNQYGQLGNSSFVSSPVPVPVTGAHAFAELAATGAFNPRGFTCGLLTSGQPMCWGTNNNGQLGDGPQGNSSTPVRVAGERLFVRLATGISHTCGMEPDGTAYCWGVNQSGQLGAGHSMTALTPAPVQGNLRFARISGGIAHTCGVDLAGAGYCWGLNAYGELGDDSGTSSTTPVPVAGGHAWSMIQAARGFPYHTCGVTTGGEVHCWGSNSFGRLGDGTTMSRTLPTRVALAGSATQVVASNGFSCALLESGAAFCWGYNQFGSLGTGNFTHTSTPQPVAGGHTFTKLSANDLHICGLDASGQAWCWGRGVSGELGNGTLDNVNVPTAVAGGHAFTDVIAGGGNISANIRGHACALDTEGVAWCWGYNGFGQAGDQSTTRRLEPVQVATNRRFVSLSLGGQFTCGIATDGETLCWGGGGQGQFGDGNGLFSPQTTPRRMFYQK